jgi:hypothetical protein
MWKLRQWKLMKKLSLVYLSDFSTRLKLFSFKFRKIPFLLSNSRQTSYCLFFFRLDYPICLAHIIRMQYQGYSQRRRRLEGWPNTVARLAGGSKENQQG